MILTSSGVPCSQATGKSQPPIPLDPTVDSAKSIVILDNTDYELGRPANKTAVSAKSVDALYGYCLPILPGRSPHSSYPFGLHDAQAFPWDYAIHNGSMFLISRWCEGRVRDMRHISCRQCRDLAQNKCAVRVLKRTGEGTGWAYYGASGLVECLKKKDAQIEFYRLGNMNQARKLLTAASTLSEYKRFLTAVASHKVESVNRIMRLGLRHKQGIRAMLKATLKAATGLYKPKVYREEDYMGAITLWKLGGDRIATIAHRTLGLPAITTIRNQLRTPHYPITVDSNDPEDQRMLRLDLRAFSTSWS